MLPLEIKYLQNAQYEPTHAAMLARVLSRIEQKKSASSEQAQLSADELWIVDHDNVFTLGQAGKPEHILQRDNTPPLSTPIVVVKSLGTAMGSWWCIFYLI